MNQMQAERRLQRAKVSLVRNPMFSLWSAVLLMGDTTVDDDTPTACTDGRNEKYGRAFVDSLNDKELCFVVLHECLHKAFRHLTTWKGLYKSDPKLANQACDHVINILITDTDPSESVCAMPRRDGVKIGLLDYRFRDMHTKQIFDILKEEQQENGGQGNGGQGSPDGFDTHDWEGAGARSSEAEEKLGQEIDQALRQGKIAHEKTHGKGTSALDRALDELMYPKVDWRREMRDFISTVYSGREFASWRRPSRRWLAQDIYMPSLTSERMGALLSANDTSGSIAKELRVFIGAMKDICEDVRPDRVDMVYWDTKVCGHEVYESHEVHNIHTDTKPVGGGGTDPTCVSQFVKDKKLEPECIIMFTDGYVGSWGEDLGIPTLWCIVNNKRAKPTFGRTIHIEM